MTINNKSVSLVIYFSLQYQGDEILDTDIPTGLEAKLFRTTGGKLIWMFLQPFFYALRPLFVHPLPPSRLEVLNVVIELTFDAAVIYFLGMCLIYSILNHSSSFCYITTLISFKGPSQFST